MNKKWIVRILFIIVIIVAVFYAGFHIVEQKGLSASTGRCIVSDNGSYLIVTGNTPIDMSNRTNNEDLFADLQTGDEIWILHDYIALTYPAQTGVYACRLLEEGEEADIPIEIMKSLAELGWVTLNENY